MVVPLWYSNTILITMLFCLTLAGCVWCDHWNTDKEWSNKEHVGYAACHPILSTGVTCHTDPGNSVSYMHVKLYI